MKKSKVALIFVIYTIIGICVCGLLLFIKTGQANRKEKEYNNKLLVNANELSCMASELEVKNDEIARLESTAKDLEDNLEDANALISKYEYSDYMVDCKLKEQGFVEKTESQFNLKVCQHMGFRGIQDTQMLLL